MNFHPPIIIFGFYPLFLRLSHSPLLFNLFMPFPCQSTSFYLDVTLSSRVGESVESALSALAAIFSAHSAYFNNFRQKIPYLTRRDKRESYLIVLQKKMFRYAKDVRLASFLALTCSLRLSLALSGSDWISSCLSLAMALCDSHSCSHCPLWHTLTLSGSLLLSNFAYTALDRLTGPLLGFHR